MPELPEVETSRRGIAPYVLNKRVKKFIIRDRRLRWPVDLTLRKKLVGLTIFDITRRGKYLIFHFETGHLLWHLGMSGSLRIVTHEPPKLHDHIDLQFDENNTLRFHDPRRFGCVLWTEEELGQHPLLRHLGPEPLTDEFSAEYLFARSRKTKQSIKTWIMDSKVVVGVGNIYANEALFNAGIHPLKAAHTLSKPRFIKLVYAIKAVLENAIARGGTTLRDFVGGDGKPGYFAQELSVYGRGGEPCTHCSKALLEKRLGQRSTVYCNVCQT